MNQQQRAVVQQALEVLKRCQMNETYRNFQQESDTIFALRQLLEQPEPVQEPVDLQTVYDTIIQWDVGGGKRSRRELARRIVDLYTTPPAQPAPTHGPYSAPIKHLWPVAQPAEPDYKQLYEQLCEQYDVLVNELKGAQPAAWVGLTDEDREQHRDDYRSNIHDDEFASIEAKLREKNGGAA